MDYYSTETENEPFNFFTTKPPEKGKRLFLYQNGHDKMFKTFVYNTRNVRDFSSFLNQVTYAVDAPAAVRNIYTPHEGHRVKNLDKLKDGASYVVGGKEGFKQVSYGMGHRVRNISLRKSLDTTSLALPPLPPLPKQIIAQARFLDNTNRPIVITVYRNGELQQKGSKILLTQRELTSWERVLEIITDKSGLFSSAKKVYTTEGRRIKVLTDFEHQGKYVAVEPNRHFKKLPYGAIELLAGQSPLKISRPIGSHPVLMRRKRIVYRPNVKSEASISNVLTTLPLQAPLTLQPIDNPDRKIKKISVSKQRPLGGRRDKEKREIEKFKFKVREDSAFAPSSATLTQADRTINSPDEQESVVYPSNNLEDTQLTSVTKLDSIKAETYYPLAEGEVEDAPGLVTEKPVDLLPTEEVHEESVQSRKQTQQNNISTADHSITDTSLPVEQVDVQPLESSTEPYIPDPQLESTQIEENSPNVTDLQEQPKIGVTNEDDQLIAEDSIEAEKDVTFDKSDTSVTDNIPVITSKNQTQVESDQGICINDAITNQQLKQLERHAEGHLLGNENNVTQVSGNETEGALEEGNNSANNGST